MWHERWASKGSQMTFSSAVYWETRYADGGDSGSGSKGADAKRKADYLNRFVKDHEIRSVLEFGCGDGHQLSLANYPDYVGLDVSATAIRKCHALFQLDSHKRFYLLPTMWPLTAELVLSLDVIYHLVENSVYRQHMNDVFGSATRHVVLYTTDSRVVDPNLYTADHVLHRPVRDHVSLWFPDWLMTDCVLTAGGSGFYTYQRR
jgi:SAM-dependent methyltransferase